MAGLRIDDDVPPARLGRLLRAGRRRQGLTLRAASRLTGIDRAALLTYERGWDRVPDEHLVLLAEHYGGTVAGLVPLRVPVELDGPKLVAGGTVRVLATQARDEILGGYLTLIATLRGTKPRPGMPLRTADLEALAATLGSDVTDVEARIVELLGCTRDEARVLHTEMLRRRVLAPAAGLALSAAFAGAIAVSPTLEESGSRATEAATTSEAEQRPDLVSPTTTAAPSASTTTAAPTTTTTAAPTTTTAPPAPAATAAPRSEPVTGATGTTATPDTTVTTATTAPATTTTTAAAAPDDPPVSIPPGETFVELDIGDAAVAEADTA